MSSSNGENCHATVTVLKLRNALNTFITCNTVTEITEVAIPACPVWAVVLLPIQERRNIRELTDDASAVGRTVTMWHSFKPV